MTKKKKIKSSSLKRRRVPVFLKFAFPVGMGSGQPMQEFLVEARHFQRGLDVLHNKVMPDQSKKSLDHVAYNLRDAMRAGTINAQSWLSLILMAETLGLTPARLFGLIGKHNSEKKLQKSRVGFLNQILVKSLLKKIDQWGGVPAAWRDHRGYINSWCKRTGTPLFKSQSNFADYVTEWREATVGKRKHRERMKKKNVTESVDREFSILNRPPKS